MKTAIAAWMFMLMFTVDIADARLRVVKSTPQERVYYVEGDFMTAHYGRLLRDLRTSKKGQSIHIIIRGNVGGIDYVAEPVLRAIQRSRATVTTESRGFVASYAVDALLVGDRVKVNHSARHLFHFFYTPGPGGSKRVDVRKSEQMMRNMKRWFSRGEWNKMRRGGNVILTGSKLCARIKARVVKRGKGYCLARGIRI